MSKQAEELAERFHYLPLEIRRLVDAAQEMRVSGEDFYDKAKRVMDAVDALEVSDV